MNRWLEGFLLLPTLVFLAYWAGFGLDNADTYFHLRAGAEMLDSGWRPWAMGHFSSLDTDAWTSSQWAPQVLMALVVKLGGLTLLALFAYVFYSAFAFILYRIFRTYAHPYFAASAVLFFVLACSTYISLRPQVWSYLLMALLLLTYLQALRRQHFPWATLAVIWVWPNFHGMWIAGLATALVLIIAQGLQYGFNWRHAAYTGALFVLPMASALGPQVWPDTVRVYLTGTHNGGFVGDEWGPTNFMTVQSFAIMALIFTAIYLVCARGRRPSWPALTLLAVGVGWTLLGTRSVPLGVLTLLTLVLTFTDRYPLAWRFSSKVWLGATASFLASFILFSALLPAYPQQNMHVPLWAEQRFSSMEPGTRVFTDFKEGSYMLYTYPNLALPVHGYADAFTPEEVNRLINVVLLRRGWDDELAAMNIEYAFWPRQSPAAYALEKAGWTTVQQDEEFILLSSPTQ